MSYYYVELTIMWNLTNTRAGYCIPTEHLEQRTKPPQSTVSDYTLPTNQQQLLIHQFVGYSVLVLRCILYNVIFILYYHGYSIIPSHNNMYIISYDIIADYQLLL
jgi:hypothetical protein